MNEKIKFSIVSPCHNGEKYVAVFLDSILNQTYTNFELIIVNDGSTDATLNILESYKSKFSEKSISYSFYSIENSGQAAALNFAFEKITGDYIMWPDSDDFYDHNTLKIISDYINSNGDVSFMRVNSHIVSENDLNTKKGLIETKKFSKNIFKDLLFEKMIICNGRFIVKTSAFDECIPNRKIFESRGGQNWQILLPVSYKYDCNFYNVPLYNYVVRSGSHSRHDLDQFDKVLKKFDLHREIILETLRPLNIDKFIIKKIEIKYAKINIKIAIKFRQRKLLVDSLNKLLNCNNFTFTSLIYVPLYSKIVSKSVFKIIGKLLLIKKRGE